MAAVMPSVSANGTESSGGDAGELQRVEQAAADQLGDRHVVGIGACRGRPGSRPRSQRRKRRIAGSSRCMRGAQAGDRFRGRRLAEQDLARRRPAAARWRRRPRSRTIRSVTSASPSRSHEGERSVMASAPSVARPGSPAQCSAGSPAGHAGGPRLRARHIRRRRSPSWPPSGFGCKPCTLVERASTLEMKTGMVVPASFGDHGLHLAVDLPCAWLGRAEPRASSSISSNFVDLYWLSFHGASEA